MKKKFLAASFMTFGMLAFSLSAVSTNATNNDIVTEDSFVFDANNLTYQNYSAGSKIGSNNNVNVMLGNNYAGQTLGANFDFGDYSFQYGLLAEEDTNTNYWTRFFRQFDSGYKSNQNLAQYYISAEEGTKCGVYYTLVDKTPVENTYYVSNNNTVKVINEKKNNKYSVADSFTEDLDYMYYSEFTFGSQKTLGLMSETQYIVLFGVTVVTETEIENRETTNEAIDNLINYYNQYGVSTSEEFNELLAAATNSLNGVNHISQIPNYSEYQNILAEHDKLEALEAKINLLKANTENGFARAFAVNVKYDAQTKALLDEITAAISESEISPASISNYYLYQMALDMYNNLEADYNNAQAVVELISNLGDVEYTDEYKNQLDTIDNLLNTIFNQDFVTNADEFFAKYDEFNAISNEKVNEFVNKVNEVNAVSGETSSYVLINEAEELYNALVSTDKANAAVVEAYNALEAAKAAYDEYEASVTDNSFDIAYNEDGTIKRVLFFGTINNFVCVSDLDEIKMYIINENTGEIEEVEITTVYKSFKVNGEKVKFAIDGVRYIYTVISNTDGQYNGVNFSMYYSLTYKDGHVITSNISTLGM